MGNATDIFVNTVRSTGGGSALYGPCEICQKDTFHIFWAGRSRVYRRENSDYYLGAPSGGTYGDMACLLERYGQLRRDEEFVRVGRTKRVTDQLFAELQRLHDQALQPLAQNHG
jgi:hypothetical protein